MKPMKIGQIASQTGIGIETIRYYERLGLLPSPQRRPSGYRQYGDETVRQLHYIRHAKELGFTLSEIRELLELSFAASACCDHIQQRAESKLEDIESKICTLKTMQRSLRKILTRCRKNGSARDCPLHHKPQQRRSPAKQ